MVLPLSTNVVERLSENSEQASFCGPTRLHNGKKRYSHRRLALPKTRDPTRPAIFQTVSRDCFAKCLKSAILSLFEACGGHFSACRTGEPAQHDAAQRPVDHRHPCL